MTRDDRFVFQGIDTRRKLPFNATLRLSDDMKHYRRADSGQMPVLAKGTMLGLRSGGDTFGAPFELFAVRGSVLAVGASEHQKRVFRDRYAETLNAAGVRNLKDTVEALLKLGIGSETWLTDRLREMRDSGDGAPLLAAF